MPSLLQIFISIILFCATPYSYGYNALQPRTPAFTTLSRLEPPGISPLITPQTPVGCGASSESRCSTSSPSAPAPIAVETRSVRPCVR